MTDFTGKVDAGIAWLDSNRPGWREEVNRDTLDMMDADNCMLGQTVGWAAALQMAVPFIDNGVRHGWDEHDTWAIAHGFMVPNGRYETLVNEYTWLTDEWLSRL